MPPSMNSILLLTAGLLASQATALAPSTISVDQATEFTLTYGYPLIPYAKWALPVMTTDGTNRLQHKRSLTTADFQDVVRPNVDTLYSAAILDLSHGDLVIDVPNVTDRYWVFPFYDAYGNNYANVGTVGGNKPGKYRIRYVQDSPQQEAGVQLCQASGQSGNCQGYQGYINAPTPYGTFLGRLAVTDEATDLRKVHSIQNQTALYAVPRDDNKAVKYAPKLTVGLLNGSLSSDIPTRIMQMTARLAPYNPPRNISDLRRVQHMFRRAGIHEGKYIPTHKNLTALAAKVTDAVLSHASKPENTLVLGNGWQSRRLSAQGDYGMDYQMRYAVAARGYLALTATEALYPMYYDASNGYSTTLILNPGQAFLFTYDGKPPLTKEGFWSLTGYNSEQYLIANPLDRYALGDRSGLTYSDGSLVYGSDSRNGTFQILVQPADVEPPKNWTSNWLPAPEGGGSFSVTFRLYAPTTSLANGEWTFPTVQRVDAIVA
ncbi:hypothetical protein FE257_005738 [Aspergillus nanangensis]|uniref:DUF1254 domain-containing protein n=1 Tax=Aspergillus nanangensis TaxID=2582783 RepID=A0AAD4GVA2_ASPNN|nr:hypothetical protein FE257_005738 [Aspergillus nanangensis]